MSHAAWQPAAHTEYAAVREPAARSSSARVGTSGRIAVPTASAPCRCGVRPVRTDAVAGSVHELCDIASAKRIAERANRSILGDVGRS